MTKYRVELMGGGVEEFEATRVFVSDHGALSFWIDRIDGYEEMAYAPFAWKTMKAIRETSA